MFSYFFQKTGSDISCKLSPLLFLFSQKTGSDISFALNVNTCFLEKIRKNISTCFYRKFYPEVILPVFFGYMDTSFLELLQWYMCVPEFNVTYFQWYFSYIWYQYLGMYLYSCTFMDNFLSANLCSRQYSKKVLFFSKKKKSVLSVVVLVSALMV